MIHVHNVSKRFRVHSKAPGLKGSLECLFVRVWQDKQALSGVDLNVRAGEIVGLLGANGAGKQRLSRFCPA